jgi:hypothetical protein
VVEPLPGYASEPNPVEALWSNLKGVELVNPAGETLHDISAAAERGGQRIQGHRTTHGQLQCVVGTARVRKHVRANEDAGPPWLTADRVPCGPPPPRGYAIPVEFAG